VTIIAAASWGHGPAYIGCDQAGTDGYGVQGEHGTKLHRAPFGWLGYTGSYRTLQAIHRGLRQVERIEGAGGMEELVGTLEKALTDAGWSRSKSDDLPSCKSLSLLIVTWAGELWTVQSDLAFLRHRHFAAVGSGYQVALGSLHTSHNVGTAPSLAVSRGLGAACDIIATCSGPVEPVAVEGAA